MKPINKDLNDNVHYAGGLRIKAIKSYDGLTNIPLVKTYKYGINESGTGRSNFILSNYYLNTEQKYKRYVWGPMGKVLAQTKRTRTFLSNPTIEIEAFDAAPVVYPYVTEYSGDGVNNTGKVIYQFADFPDVVTSASFVKPIITSYFYRRGQLLNKKIYKRSGSSYQLLKESGYTYTAFPQSIYFGGLVVKQNEVGGNVLPPGLDPNDSQNWLFSNYTITSDDNLLTAQTEKTYSPEDVNKYVETTNSFVYGNIIHQQPTEIVSTDSKGNEIKEKTKYPADYIISGNSITGNLVFDTMLAKNIQALSIEKVNSLKKLDGNETVTKGRLDIYRRLASGSIVKDNLKQLTIDKPVSDFQNSTVNAGIVNFDSRYATKVNFDFYDEFAKVKQYTVNNSEVTSYIYGYANNLPITEIKNALETDVGYTSFESESKGNWVFSGSPSTIEGGITGLKSYPLASGIITKSGLATSKKYVISYWAKGSVSVTGATPVAGKSIKGWTYYEANVTGISLITISGNGYIDELRLYPVRTQMSTYTYEPLLGMTSECDANNKITYYKYDTFGRLSLICDQDGNIMKNFCYNYQGQQGDCTLYGNTAVIQNFTKNDCTPGTSGSVVPYTVAAKTYYGSTQAEANSLAQNDIAFNGQIYANATGTCTASLVAIQGYNSKSVTYQVKFTNTSTGNWYVFFLNANTYSPVSLGQVPAGNYTVLFYPMGGQVTATYSINGYTMSDQTGAVFYNIPITSSSTASMY